jgi:hypothetical protein
MANDRWQLAAHLLYGVAGIIAVTLMTFWQDISGPTALVVIMGLTGTTGANGLAATTTPSAVAQSLADRSGDVTHPHTGV